MPLIQRGPRSRTPDDPFDHTPAECRHTGHENIADIPDRCHSIRMRLYLILLPLLVGCSAEEAENGASDNCGETFCLPSSGRLLTKEETSDFNTYQVKWDSKQFGIYEGDFPTLSHSPPEPIVLPVDGDAKLWVGDDMGIVNARVGDGWPRFLEITGPCWSLADCPVADFSRGLAPVR